LKPTETTPSAKNLPVSIERRYDMDALRGIAMYQKDASLAVN